MDYKENNSSSTVAARLLTACGGLPVPFASNRIEVDNTTTTKCTIHDCLQTYHSVYFYQVVSHSSLGQVHNI